MFSCEFGEISKNTFSNRTPPMASSERLWKLSCKLKTRCLLKLSTGLSRSKFAKTADIWLFGKLWIFQIFWVIGLSHCRMPNFTPLTYLLPTSNGNPRENLQELRRSTCLRCGDSHTTLKKPTSSLVYLNFQFMKSPVEELNNLLSKFSCLTMLYHLVCYITWLDATVDGLQTRP